MGKRTMSRKDKAGSDIPQPRVLNVLLMHKRVMQITTFIHKHTFTGKNDTFHFPRANNNINTMK